MRLVMLGPFPPPIHGMSLANEMLYKGLTKNHEVYRVNTKSGLILEDISKQGKFNLKKIYYAIWPIIKGVTTILFGKRLDVIYITPGQSGLGYIKYIPFMWAANVRSIPYFIHIHGGSFRDEYDKTSGIKRKLINYSLKRLAGAIILGDSLKYMFQGLIPDEKIYICENGVEDDIFATEEEIEKKVAQYDADDTIRILYLSNLLKTKGILDLFEAIKLLNNRNIKVHLDVAGSIEPEIEDEVNRYLSELGESAKYHGVVTGQKKKGLLLRNYIFCLPTYYPNEGQPISILEAMACGCTIVTTDQGGIRDIVNSTYGSFVDKKDPTGLAEAIINSYKCYNDKGINGWKIAKDKFTLNDFYERIELILDNSYSSNDNRFNII